MTITEVDPSDLVDETGACREIGGEDDLRP